jgi:hypothetical protein
MEELKCNRCKVNLPVSKFIKNRADKWLKSCNDCRAYQKKFRDTNKCEHDKRLHNCKECGGSQICEHNRQRNKCKECGGSQICEHNRQRSQCKECGGTSMCKHDRRRSQCKECGGTSICKHDRRRNTCKECGDPIKITIENWIFHSKQKDKLYNRLDLPNLIDTDFCKNLIEEYPNCIYCKIELQYVLYKDDLATIERVDNTIGHIKSNCKIACLSFNASKVGNNI